MVQNYLLKKVCDSDKNKFNIYLLLLEFKHKYVVYRKI